MFQTVWLAGSMKSSDELMQGEYPVQRHLFSRPNQGIRLVAGLPK
jgi:hypothetical protein